MPRESMIRRVTAGEANDSFVKINDRRKINLIEILFKARGLAILKPSVCAFGR
jgi:hypothetical protein